MTGRYTCTTMTSPPEGHPLGLTTDGDDGNHRVKPFRLAADLHRLGSRRRDLSDTQRHELYFAAASLLRGRSGMAKTTSWPPTAAIFAWIDTVSPTAPDMMGARTTLAPGGEAPEPGEDAVRLLLGPEPGAMAGHLAALAARRSDLSHTQRHELYVAARARLRRGYGKRAAAPSRAAIFAWIDLMVPARAQPVAPPVERSPGRPTGSRYIADRAAVIGAYRRARKLPSRNPSAIPSQQVVAGVLDVSRRTLARFLKAQGIPWPPE